MGDRLRELRKRRGLTQEELAHASNLSLQVVKKIERGGSARLETLHQLARTLDVVTLTFVGSTSPEPKEDNDVAVLADLRSAITPPVGLTGRPIYGSSDGDDLDLERLLRAVKLAEGAYRTNRYDDLASFLPALIRSAHHHVDGYASNQSHRDALRLRADVVGLAGRYLIQIRAHDLALVALHASLRDALDIEDATRAAAAVSGQAHAMLRQGRFHEVERLCSETAAQLEPQLSKATPGQLSAWGWMLLRASAAAARNNRPKEAMEYQGIAAAAAAPLRHEHATVDQKTFGPTTVALKTIENALVSGAPDKALALSSTLSRTDDLTNEEWDRHLLDRARASVQTGDSEAATELLVELRRRSPQWLRYQQPARDTLREILATRNRRLTEQQRILADHMKITD
ncbi:helix-turn-helix domain-containing protein [Sinosporangium siamense]|uniref:helix-turn-helix domain-containing protein n=1 Tax=Sinosporangium siamense TaxID=1367973 RepID=UPI0035F0AC07